MRIAWKNGTIAAVLFVGACGGGQTRGSAFDGSWSNDDGAAIGAFQKRFASTQIPTGASVAVGLRGDTIIGMPLEGGAVWSHKHALDSRPVIAGTVVVGLGAGELFALDAKSGKLLWKRPAGGKLRGAGDDGRTTIVSILPTTGKGSLVLAVAHDGTVVRQIEDDAPIGVPAVVDGYAFLPWKGQYVSAYNLVSGEETARALLRQATSRAFTMDGALFFGETSATRFDDKIGLGSQSKASTVILPAIELPGVPRWMPEGTAVEPRKAMAPDKIRLYARPATTGPAAIEGDRVVATYYRIATGFEASSGAVAWAHAHGSDLMGGAAYKGGFALCDAKGTVTFLDARTGVVAGEVMLGQPVDACAVQAEGFTRTADAAPKPLAEQLAAAVRMPEAELVSMQQLLLREMAKLEDESVTTALIDRTMSDRTPPLLLADAREALAKRRNGVDAMLAALGKRYDFLAGVLRPPPVGPLADALAALGEKRAAPLLAAHLLDPVDTPDDVRRAAVALGALATKAELPTIEAFFAQYRCVADDDLMSAAVAAAGGTMRKLGQAAPVAFAIEDPFTTEIVKARLVELGKKK